jgi:hypothetical protein
MVIITSGSLLKQMNNEPEEFAVFLVGIVASAVALDRSFRGVAIATEPVLPRKYFFDDGASAVAVLGTGAGFKEGDILVLRDAGMFMCSCHRRHRYLEVMNK